MDRFELLERAADAAWLGGDLRRAVALRRDAVAGFDQAERPGARRDPARATGPVAVVERRQRSRPRRRGAGRGHHAQRPTDRRAGPDPRRARADPHAPRPVGGVRGRDARRPSRWPAASAPAQAEGHARNTLGLDLAVMGRCADGIASLRGTLAIAYEVGNADDIGRAHVNLCEAVLHCGDPRRALADRPRGDGRRRRQSGVTGTYGSFVRENGITIAYELGEWAQAVRLGRGERRARPAQHPPAALSARALAAAPRRRAGTRVRLTALDEMRGFVDGTVVESQFNAPYRGSPERRRICGPASRTGPWPRPRSGWARSRRSRGTGYNVRLHRVGAQAAADLAEVARAGRDLPAGASRPARRWIACGPASPRSSRRCWLAAMPVRLGSPRTGRPQSWHSSMPRPGARPGESVPRRVVGRSGALARPWQPVPVGLRPLARSRGAPRDRGPRRRHGRPRRSAVVGEQPRRAAVAGRRRRVWPRGQGCRSAPHRSRRSPAGVASVATAGRSVRTDRARARCPAAARPGTDQPPDRRDAVHQREHGRGARFEHPGQARCAPHGREAATIAVRLRLDGRPTGSGRLAARRGLTRGQCRGHVPVVDDRARRSIDAKHDERGDHEHGGQADRRRR